MALDYGTRARASGRREGWLRALARAGMAVGVIGPILVLGSIPTLIGVAANAPDPDNPRRGSTGEPCRAVSRAAFEAGWREPPRRFTYQGVMFARRRGDADCTILHEGALRRPYPACRLSSPAALAVTAGGRSVYFDVGPGVTAEVEARPSGVRCVVTGRHRMEGLGVG